MVFEGIKTVFLSAGESVERVSRKQEFRGRGAWENTAFPIDSQVSSNVGKIYITDVGAILFLP